MSSNFIRTKDGQNCSKLNVFERLTMKKGQKTDNTAFKSHINLKQKTPITSVNQTPRGYLTSSKFYERKHEKDIEKVILNNSNNFLVMQVQYAEHGLVIELQSELNGNKCKIQMDYNQYDVLINGLDHHFMMPIMQISVKMVKVILSQEWFPDCSISIYRTKHKIKQYQIQTNAILTLNLTKTVQIDPFKQIQQSQLKRKKMLLNNIPKLKMDKIVCKTQADQSSIQQPQSEQLLNSALKNVKSNKSLNKSEFYLSPSSRRNLIKKDIFKLMTPRSRILQQQKQDQKTQKKVTRHFDFGFGSPKYNKKSTISQNIQSFLKLQPQQVNAKVLSSVTKTKSNIYCSPKRI